MMTDQDAKMAGCDDFLVKPFTHQKLQRVIQTYLPDILE